MTPARPERPSRLPLLVLAALVYVPLLFTAPGRVGADTKTYLYLDPSKLLSRAWSMWDPSIGLGTVSHQNIGYLWPMGPWYWVFDRLGAPDWVAQRLWLGTIIFVAGAGALWLMRSVLGWRTAPATVTAFAYALTPYVLTLAARLSAILLPFAGLPWMLGLTVLSVRRGGWRWPALFALVVATVGSVNATALLLAGLAPLWWLVYARASGEATTGQVLRAAGRIGLLTVVANLWWIAGLWAQGGWGIDILRFTETAEVVASASNAVEVLRGLGYWFFYGGDRLGPWIEPGSRYTQSLLLLLVTYGLPLAALVGALRIRFRHRSYFLGLLALGLIAAVGAHPWDDPPIFGRLVKAFQNSDAGLAMRSLPRATPLVALGAAACLGAGTDAAAQWLRARSAPRQRTLGRALPALAVATTYLVMTPLWSGEMVARNLDRPEDLPRYWLDATAYLDERGEGTRVLEVPGSDFASYRWGNTVDPITPGLIDRPYAARELIPYGSPASAELLGALDLRMQEGTLEPSTVAAIARLLAAGDVVLRDDLQFERYRTPRPYVLSPLLAAQEGLTEPATFGEPTINRPRRDVPLEDELALAADDRQPRSPVEVFGVEDPEPIVRSRPYGAGVVMAADGNGLVDAASAGVIDGHELIRYGADLGTEGVVAALVEGDRYVITDGNRMQGRRWSTVRDNLGLVEPPAPTDDDLTDNRLPVFPDAEEGWQTTALSGDVEVSGSNYGNPVTFTAEYRPANAVDGDVTTEWRVGAGRDVRGEHLDIRPAGGTMATALRLVQQISGVQNRFVREVEIRRDDLPPQRVVLDDSSRTPEGQVVILDPPSSDPFEQLTVEIVADTSDLVPRWGRPVRWGGMTQVGFAEIELLAEPGEPTGQYADSALLLPPAATAAIDDDTELDVVLTRWRVDATDPVRFDPEPAMTREWDQPVARTYVLDVTARLDPRAVGELLDASLATEGPVVQTDGHLVGVPAARGSAALDGDGSTAWIPGFFHQNPWLLVTTREPTTITELAPVLLDDERHSVATELTLEVDGELVGSFPIEGDGTAVALPDPVTGTTFRFTVSGLDPVQTREWYGNGLVDVPVAIAELGVPELAVDVPDRLDTGCRTDLLTIDGDPVAVRIQAPTADLIAGRPVTADLCDGAVELAAGRHRLQTANGPRVGIDIDQVVLHSSGPERRRAPAVAPEVRVTDDGRWFVDVDVDDAVPGQPFWLVLGQSYSTGWHLDGVEPTLVDGYANGWVVEPATEALHLELVWEPQRTVNRSLALSAVGVVGCIALAVVGARRDRRHPPPPAPTGLVTAGRPTTAWRAGIALAAVAGTLVLIGPVSAVVVGAVTAVALWGPPAIRRHLWLLPVAAYGMAAGYVVAKQVKASPTAAFEWPAEQATAHQFALVCVALTVVLVAVQSRLDPPPAGLPHRCPDEPLGRRAATTAGPPS